MNRLVKLREERDLTQQKMATLLNISNVALHYYETGQRNIPQEIAVKMASILNVSVDEIFLPERFSIR